MASKRIRRPVRNGRLGGSRYWMAMGTLAAYSTAGGGKQALAFQASNGGYTKAADPIQALPVRRYAIAGGSLEDVIAAFEKVAELKVQVAEHGMFSLNSPGVNGSFTPAQALQLLLANTGLVFRAPDSHTVILEFKTATSSVSVTAGISNLADSLPKYPEPLINTPQTIDVVPQQTMQQQGTTTLRDALRNVSGISLAAGEGGSQGDNLTIRGFTARNDLFIDGMRDFGSYYRDPFNTQEVEVLQGPSSVTFGRGSTGGVVNQASKRPGLTPAISGDLDFGTDATRRATVDIDMPLPKLGSGAAFRLNAMGNIGNVAGRDVAEVRRDGIAPSLALGLGGPTRLTLSYFHQNADDIPDYGIPWQLNGPAPVNRNNYYGLKNGNFLRTYDDIGTVRLEHDINDKVQVRNQVRYANYVRDALITEAQLPTPGASTATRHEIGVNSTETYLDEQADVVAHVETGPIRHTLMGGIEAGRETSAPTRPAYTAPGTSLFDPDPTQSLNPGVTIASKVQDAAISESGYVLDTASIGKHWQLTGGLRYDRFDNTYKQLVAPAANFNRVDQKPTWRTAAVYKPVSFGSLYFDAGTSFNPSAESLSLSAGTVNLPPETNRTYEFGTKWEFNKSRLIVNSSWFRTFKDNAREASPTNSLLYVLAGNQRVSGVEADVRGRITSRWEMLAGYAYLDSRVISSEFYPKSIGYPLGNVPRHTFNYWSTYRLPKHFEFGAGANYVSSRTASSTAPLDPTTGLVRQAPGYWVFNAMASHPLGEHVDIQVNAYNLANRYYYDQLHPAHIVPGPGRTALVGFKFKF